MKSRGQVLTALAAVLFLNALPAQAQAPQDPALRDRILGLRDTSKKAIAEVTGGGRGPVVLPAGAADKLHSIVQLVTSEMRAIIDEVGWPGYHLVGAEAASAAARLMIQVRDLPLKERALALLEQAVAASDAAPIDLAYLTDNVRVNSGRPQVYGTVYRMNQFGDIVVATIADSAGVDARRKAVGLGPLADSLRAVPVPALPPGVTPVRPDR